MNFTGKTAVVTGGRGIGRAICEELARGGANVVLCYAGRAEAAQETVTACEDLGAKALAVQCNVADEAQVKALMDAAVKEFGRIDILVNNAGVTRDGLVMMMKEADFDAVIDTNLKGTFLCMKAVSRIMMKQRYGRIVNLSSVVGLRGNAGQVNYAASKAGVVGMTKSLAKELASRGVTVNAVAPGFIETDMTAAMPQAAKDAMMPTIPMQRLGAPEDVAKAVAFLASLLRNIFGLGSLLAFPGSMCGALLCGLVYWKTRNLPATLAGEVFGTGIIGGLLSYPVAVAFMGVVAGSIAFYAYVVPFLVSTVGGSILAGILVFTLQKSGALKSMRAALEH